jgi:N-acetylglucosamine malate deacetylase 1
MESQFASGLLESESPQNSGGAMKIDLLAIAAHPDDVELTSGGTLLKMAAEGYATGILDLTRGETGTRGTPETRLKEAQTAARILKVQVRRNLRLKVCDEYKQAIAEVIRDLQPRTVILPYWDGRHPDHNAAAALGYEACFIAGLKNYPMAGEAFRPFKILYAAAYEGARPTFAVDISKYYLRRRDAILAYKSQFSPPKRERGGKVYLPLDELEERMSLQAKHYGRMIGVQYAEAYIAKEIMEVNDVVSLPVRSM